MASLFGFAGIDDDALLARMDDVLRHRGRAPLQTAHVRHTRLGFRSTFEDGDATLPCEGLHVEGEQALALAGFVTSEPARGRGLAAVREATGDAEVAELRLAVCADEHVRGLDVAVNDIA